MRISFLLVIVFYIFIPDSSAKTRQQFDENHSDMFIFLELPKESEKYNYSSFCKKVGDGCTHRLSYRKYVGKRGYFTSLDPVEQNGKFVTREVILENGKRLYYRTYSSDGSVLGSTENQIEFLSVLEERDAQMGVPIIEGSSVISTNVERRGGKFVHYFGDDKAFYDEELSYVRKLLRSQKSRINDQELIDILKLSNTKFDKIENRFLIGTAGYSTKDGNGPLDLSIVYKDNTSVLVQKVKYYSEDWIFADSYILVAGDTRYESPKLRFNRDNSSGKVWEWHSEIVDATISTRLRNVIASDDPVIRFNGDTYYSDKPISDSGKEALRRMMRLHELLSNP